MAWPASWLDGTSPVAHAATVEAEPTRLRIAPEGLENVLWPIEEVRVVSEPGAAELRLAAGDDSRLVVAEAKAAAALLACLRDSRRRHRFTARRRRRRIALAATVVLAITGIALGWPWVADLLVRATPLSAEIALGEAVESKLFAEARRCDRPGGAEALQNLVARLAPHAGAAMPLSVTVLDDPQVNAAAMPGGRIVIFRGLLRAAVSPEEVAGVVAHEMGHAAARHGMRGLYRGLGLSLLAGLLSGGGTLADAAVWFATMAHSRDFEREADRRAVAMLGAAGIGTEGLIDFFARMEARRGDPSGLLAYAASHPPSAERRAGIPATTAPPPLDHGQWQALRAICG